MISTRFEFGIPVERVSELNPRICRFWDENGATCNVERALVSDLIGKPVQDWPEAREPVIVVSTGSIYDTTTETLAVEIIRRVWKTRNLKLLPGAFFGTDSNGNDFRKEVDIDYLKKQGFLVKS